MQTTPSPFYDLESDFYHYMILYGRIAPKTCHDYVTRMRFLAKYYTLDSNFSEERIQEIMDQEKKTYTQRDKYCTPKALSDLHAGLSKVSCFRPVRLPQENRGVRYVRNYQCQGRYSTHHNRKGADSQIKGRTRHIPCQSDKLLAGMQRQRMLVHSCIGSLPHQTVECM